jgi:hypothetical protein
LFDANQNKQLELLDSRSKIEAIIDRKFTDTIEAENLETYYSKLKTLVIQTDSSKIDTIPA